MLFKAQNTRLEWTYFLNNRTLKSWLKGELSTAEIGTGKKLLIFPEEFT